MKDVAGFIKTVASGIFLIAGLIYFGTMVTLYSYADGMQRGVRETTNPKDPFRSKKLKIEGHRDTDGKGFKSGYLEMAKFHDLDAGRRASFSAYVRVSDLLKPGETAPKPEMLAVFAKSRAVLYAQGECERLLEALASQCVVNYVDGRVEDGLVQISGTLDFVQKDEFGVLDPQLTYVFAEVRDSEAAKQAMSGAGAADRMAAYRRIAKKCAEIRVREGNCAITDINANVSRSRGAYTLNSAANYAFLMRKAG